MTTRIRRGVRQTICDGVSCRASAFDSGADERWRADDGRRDYHLCPRCFPAWDYADRLDSPERGR